MSILKVNTIQNTSGTVQPFGITMHDNWVLTSTANVNSTADITSNWARHSDQSAALAGNIGTGMSQSSGVFTFPSAGIYLVQSMFTFKGNGGRTYVGVRHPVSTNSGSSYTNVCSTYGNGYMNTAHINVVCSNVIDVTDASTYRMKISYDVSDTVQILGYSTDKHTGVTFTRLGDT
tara:strand:- start:1170 stop:1697 length:528 start_codon:yes stop_codon:yes gene_type:complete